MKPIPYLLAGVVVTIALSCGCFRQDTRTVVFNVPQMKAAECSKIIQGALSRMDGIITAEPDLEKHTMTVTYDGLKLGIMNIESAIADAGFDVNQTPGKPDAKGALPAPCR